jgi:cold shock protein
MGKYRDHRQPRKRVYDPYQRDERPEPSYFERSAAPAPQPLLVEPTSLGAEDAELLWFNAGRCFGFVKLSDGSSAYLHGSRLQAAGYSDLSEGTRLTIRTEIGPKGPQVAEVVSVTMGGGSVAGIPSVLLQNLRFGRTPKTRSTAVS